MAGEVKKKLLMTFKSSNESRVSLSLDKPRADVSEAEIKHMMDLIVAKNIFAPNGAELVSPIEAKIIVTDTTEYDLA